MEPPSSSRSISVIRRADTGVSGIKKSDDKSKTKKKMACPYCRKYSLITFKDYKINISCCGTFSFEEYYNKLSETNHKSNKKEELITIYNERKQNNENMSESEINEYFCQNHKKEYIFYCQECKKDLCELCECKHEKTKLIKFENMPKDIKEEELKEKVEKLQNDIDSIKSILVIMLQVF